MVYRYYNLTNLTNTGNQTTLYTMANVINDQMNYIPGTLIMITIYIILLLSLLWKGFDVFRSFAAVSWVCMILAIIAYAMSLITGTSLLVFTILAPISLIILFFWGG